MYPKMAATQTVMSPQRMSQRTSIISCSEPDERGRGVFGSVYFDFDDLEFDKDVVAFDVHAVDGNLRRRVFA